MTGQHREVSAHDVVNLGEDALEGELDIGRLQGGGLDEGQALLLAKLLRVVRVHAPQVPAGSGLSKVSACRHPRESIPAAKPRPAPDLVRNIRCFEPLSLLTACRQCAKRATYKVQAEQPGGLTTATLASNSSTSATHRRSLLFPTSMMTMLASAWSRSSFSHRSTFSNVTACPATYTNEQVSLSDCDAAAGWQCPCSKRAACMQQSCMHPAFHHLADMYPLPATICFVCVMQTTNAYW